MRFLRALCLLSLSLTAACGSVTFRPLDGDAGVDGEVSGDAAIDGATDAAIDAPLPPPGTARELTVVGGAATDGRFRFEVEITGGITGGPAASATHTFTHAIAVNPQGAN
jgi:hypothetical protein